MAFGILNDPELDFHENDLHIIGACFACIFLISNSDLWGHELSTNTRAGVTVGAHGAHFFWLVISIRPLVKRLSPSDQTSVHPRTWSRVLSYPTSIRNILTKATLKVLCLECGLSSVKKIILYYNETFGKHRQQTRL